MPNYRIYSFSFSGHVAGPPTIVDAKDDEQAIQRAKALFDGDLEVWDEKRLVAKVKAEDPLKDHRAAPRHKTLKGGSISWPAGIVDCMIRNMSETGVLLEVANPTGIPDSFTLIIKPELLKRLCEATWRSDNQIGARFV